MHKARRSLVVFAALAALAVTASYASAAPLKEAPSFCNSLHKVTKLAVDEALTRPDKDIFRTAMYQDLIQGTQDVSGAVDVFKLAFETAKDIVDHDGDSSEAASVVKASCLRAFS